jgi:hypothetical protein
MPAQPAVLAELCKTKMHNEILAVYQQRHPDTDKYHGPLNQRNPMYFIQFANAIGQGIAQGTPLVNFTTLDVGVMGTPPVPGTGAGVGIVFDAAFFEQTAYTHIRNAMLATFSKCAHDPYPPRLENSGMYLKAMCKAVGESIAEHYKTAWILTSAHPLIYVGTGKINNGMFSGIQQDLVYQSILSLGFLMRGQAWPIICQEIAKAYKLTIETKSTGQVTIVGVCIPSIYQLCMINSTGAGTGTAT